MEFNWNDAKAIIEKIKSYDEVLISLLPGEKFSDILEEQENFIYEAINQTPMEFSHDKETLLSLIKCSSMFYLIVGEELRYDKDILYAMLLKNDFKYKDGPRTLYCHSSSLFDGATEEVLGDKKFILKCIGVDVSVLQYVTEDLLKDPEFIQHAYTIDPTTIKYFPRDIHIDKEYVIDAVMENAWNLEYIPYEYENDMEILLAAINKKPRSFRVASDYFKNNEELTIEVIRKYGVPLEEINFNMWESTTFVLEMVKLFGNKALQKVVFSEKLDLDFAKKLMEIDFACYSYLPEKLKNNEEVLMILQKETKKLEKQYNTKTEEEKELDNRWDDFLKKLMKDNMMQIPIFQQLFFDTFWYFKNRKDVGILWKGGWHILSCLCALCKMPYEFIPKGCAQNEYNAARCLSEDLFFEIRYNMPGFYSSASFVIERYCEPPAGCSCCSAEMCNFDAFLRSFHDVVSDFDDGFDAFRCQNYSDRYNIIIKNR